MNEKRVLLASIISIVFFAVYAQYWQTRLPKQSTQTEHSLSEKSANLQAASDAYPALQDEPVITLGTPALTINLGTRTASIHAVKLETFRAISSTENLLVHGDYPLVAWGDNTGGIQFSLKESTLTKAIFEAKKGETTLTIHYELDTKEPILNISILSASEAEEWVMWNAWYATTGDISVNNSLQAVFLSNDTVVEAGKYYKRRAPVKRNYNVPRGTKSIALTEMYFCQAIDFKDFLARTALLSNPANHVLLTRSIIPQEAVAKGSNLRVYFGSKDYFHLQSAGFEHVLHLGILGRIGLNLLTFLSWIAKLTRNYGLAIILFSGIVTLCLSPFTLMSIRSSRKMQEIQPQLDKIREKHKDDPIKASQEQMELFRKHKVNLGSGCLPALLPWPILIALLQAINNFVELRGRSFLWIQDLSLPDRFAVLPFSLPIIGHEIHLLPLLVGLAMFFQMRLSQGRVKPDPNNPATTVFSGPILPVMFTFMMYRVPAGIVLYWLSNSLMAMFLYRFALKSR